MSRRNFLKSLGVSTGGLLLSPTMRAAQARNPLQIPERYDGTVIDVTGVQTCALPIS